jgi:Putative Ig domain
MQDSTRLALRLSALGVAVALSACNIEGATTPTTEASAAQPAAATGAVPATSMATVNIAPAITGTAVATAVLGSGYSFTPNATDVNSDGLTFSIQNKPSWAQFNAATGQLFGTPNIAGVSANIVIGVTDGKATTTLAPFAITVAVAGTNNGSALVSWSAPTMNSDGSALTDLAGFHVYYGTDPGNLTRVDVQGANNVTYSAGSLIAGTYYFTVAAYNGSGVESAQPAVISTVIG